MVTVEHDHDEWREANPEAALAEAISVAIGCIHQHESDEARRAAAINVLIAAHQKALAEFAWLKRTRLN
jgi:hypothetical protein